MEEQSDLIYLLAPDPVVQEVDSVVTEVDLEVAIEEASEEVSVVAIEVASEAATVVVSVEASEVAIEAVSEEAAVALLTTQLDRPTRASLSLRKTRALDSER